MNPFYLRLASKKKRIGLRAELIIVPGYFLKESTRGQRISINLPPHSAKLYCPVAAILHRIKIGSYSPVLTTSAWKSVLLHYVTVTPRYRIAAVAH